MLNIFRKIRSSEQGSVIMFVAIMLPIFMLCMLLAIDASKAMAVKTKTASVQDAVGLAYSGVKEETLVANNISRQDYALRFSQLNLGTGYLGADYQVDISNISADRIKTSTQTINGTGKPYFAGAAGVSGDALGTGAAAKIQMNSSNAATSPTLLSLVLDGSGSMNGQAIIDLKTSVANLVNSALQKNSDKDFWISQVVYGSSTKSDKDFSSSYLTVMNWASDISSGGGTCGACGLDSANTRIKNKIESDIKYTSYNKVVVFMTDGRQNVKSNNPKPGVKDAAEDALDKCTILKNAGYTVYVVTFSNEEDKGEKVDIDIIKNCSSPGKYFHAHNGQQLIEVFNTIITKIIRIRMVE